VKVETSQDHVLITLPQSTSRLFGFASS